MGHRSRSREIEFSFLTADTIPMKFGNFVQHAHGYKKKMRRVSRQI